MQDIAHLVFQYNINKKQSGFRIFAQLCCQALKPIITHHHVVAV